MVSHFLRRDARDFWPWWLLVGLVTGLAVAMYQLSFGFGAVTLLFWAYFIFALAPLNWIPGSVWRTQHNLSRHYLLALPAPRWRLFAVQHARMVVFWIPLLSLAAALPVVPGWLARVESAGLYYFALLTSCALLLESSVWSALDQERITRHVETRWRLLAWAKNFAVSMGTMALLWVAWADFLFSTARLHRLAKDPFLSFVQIGRGLSFVLFPAYFLLAALWAWRNSPRWSVTD